MGCFVNWIMFLVILASNLKPESIRIVSHVNAHPPNHHQKVIHLLRHVVAPVVIISQNGGSLSVDVGRHTSVSLRGVSGLRIGITTPSWFRWRAMSTGTLSIKRLPQTMNRYPPNPYTIAPVKSNHISYSPSLYQHRAQSTRLQCTC